MIFRKHWYLFVFIDQSSGLSVSNTMTGYRTKGISLGRINENKINAKVTDNAMLVNVVHLGYMSRHAFLKNCVEKHCP